MNTRNFLSIIIVLSLIKSASYASDITPEDTTTQKVTKNEISMGNLGSTEMPTEPETVDAAPDEFASVITPNDSLEQNNKILTQESVSGDSAATRAISPAPETERLAESKIADNNNSKTGTANTVAEQIPAANIARELDTGIEHVQQQAPETNKQAQEQPIVQELNQLDNQQEITPDTAEKMQDINLDSPEVTEPTTKPTDLKQAPEYQEQKTESADTVSAAVCDGSVICCPAPVACVQCPRRICRPACCRTRPYIARRCLPCCPPACCPLPRPTVCPDPVPVCCPPPRARCCKVRRYCCPRPVKHCPPAVYCSPVPSICPMPRVVCPAERPGYCYKPVCQPVPVCDPCVDNKNLITYKHMEHIIGPNQRVLIAKQVQTSGDRTGATVQEPKKTSPKVKAQENAEIDRELPETDQASGEISELMA